MKTYTKINGKIKRCKIYLDLGETVLARVKSKGDYEIKKTDIMFLNKD